MNIVRIDCGRLIPGLYTLVASMIMALAYFGIFLHTSPTLFIIFGIILSPILPILWTTRTIIEINPTEKYSWEFYWILGLKIGDKVYYEGIEKIYVNEVGMSRRMTSYGGHVSTERFSEYVGFIKFSDGTTLELDRKRNKTKVLQGLTRVAKKLNTPLIDNTKSQDKQKAE